MNQRRYLVAFPMLEDDSKKPLNSVTRIFRNGCNSEAEFVRDHHIVVSQPFYAGERTASTLDASLGESDIALNYSNFRLDGFGLHVGGQRDALYLKVACRGKTKEQLRFLAEGMARNENLTLHVSDEPKRPPYVVICRGNNLASLPWVNKSLERMARDDEKGPDWFGGLIPCLYTPNNDGTWVRLSELETGN